MKAEFMKEPLPTELVARGEITKQLLCKEEKFEIAILELSVDAEIAMHDHPNSKEVYFDIKTGKILDVVEVGASHHFVNETGKVLRILAVKVFV